MASKKSDNQPQKEEKGYNLPKVLQLPKEQQPQQQEQQQQQPSPAESGGKAKN